MVRAAAADIVRLARSDTRPCHWAFSVLGLSSSLLQWVGPGPGRGAALSGWPGSQWDSEPASEPRSLGDSPAARQTQARPGQDSDSRH